MNFFKAFISPEGDVSSKRVLGAFCLLTFVAFIIVSLFVDYKPYQVEMIEMLPYFGSALLGLGIFDKFKKVITKK